MLLRYSFKFLLLIAFVSNCLSQTPVPMASQPGLTYSENFADIANWEANFISGIGASRFKGLSAEFFLDVPHPRTHNTETTVFRTGTQGGIQRGTLVANGERESIIFLATGATDNISSTAIDLYLDFTGLYAHTLSFDWETINNSTGNRRSSFYVYGTVDGVNFVRLNDASVINFINNSPSNGSISEVPLPAIFHRSPNARLRFYYFNGSGGNTGSRPKLSIDNIKVTALDPTVAVAGIGGKVVTVDGRGISGAVLTISGGNLVRQKTAITNPFGFYRFEGLEAGQTYIVTVGSKRYLFSTPTRSIELLDNINGYDFIAEPR